MPQTSENLPSVLDILGHLHYSCHASVPCLPAMTSRQCIPLFRMPLKWRCWTGSCFEHRPCHANCKRKCTPDLLCHNRERAPVLEHQMNLTKTAEQILSIHTASDVDRGGDGEAEMSREICIKLPDQVLGTRWDLACSSRAFRKRRPPGLLFRCKLLTSRKRRYGWSNRLRAALTRLMHDELTAGSQWSVCESGC